MLQQFGDQLRIVKDSGEPMNVLLDEESMAELIHGGAWVHEKEVRGGAHPVHTSFRFNYHRGYNHGDSDRYGPAVHRIMDLMCRLEGLDTADWK